MTELDLGKLVQTAGIAFIVLMMCAGVAALALRHFPSRKKKEPEQAFATVNVTELSANAVSTIGTITSEEGWCVVCGVATASQAWPGYGESRADEGWTNKDQRRLHHASPLYVVTDIGRATLCATHKRVAVRTLESKLGEVVRRRAEFNSIIERELAECETTLLAVMQLDQRRTVEAMRAVAAAVHERPAPQLPASARGTMTLAPSRGDEEGEG